MAKKSAAKLHQFDIGINGPVLKQVAREYTEKYPFDLYAIDPDGCRILGRPACTNCDSTECLEVRKLALQEALRWGDPTVESCPDGHLIWAIPIMHNSQVLGGIIAGMAETELANSGGGSSGIDVQNACTNLRLVAEKHNLTNGALLTLKRMDYQREQQRAHAIHEIKLKTGYNLRQTYLQEEPSLLAALRKGNLREARLRINRLLTAISYHAAGDFELTKSYFMELVTTMCRTAVEAGGDVGELLGTNYSNVVKLSQVETEEELAPWLHQTLERILISMQRQAKNSAPVLLSSALRYISEHFSEDITRDEVAAFVYMSRSHFSRSFRTHVGRTFVDYINQMRVDRAAELLIRTGKSLAQISLDVGFADQSYFTKVFKRYTGESPGSYRKGLFSHE